MGMAVAGVAVPLMGGMPVGVAMAIVLVGTGVMGTVIVVAVIVVAVIVGTVIVVAVVVTMAGTGR